VRLSLAGAIFLAAAHGASAEAISIPAPPDRGVAALTLFSLPAGGLPEVLPPVKSSLSRELPRTWREQLLAPAPLPPALVKNPFLPAAP
jgi:hypothetical protein